MPVDGERGLVLGLRCSWTPALSMGLAETIATVSENVGAHAATAPKARRAAWRVSSTTLWSWAMLRKAASNCDGGR